jgi:hypothetical protein
MGKSVVEQVRRVVTREVKAEAIVKAADSLARADFEEEGFQYPGWDALGKREQKAYAMLAARVVRIYLIEVVRIAKANGEKG